VESRLSGKNRKKENDRRRRKKEKKEKKADKKYLPGISSSLSCILGISQQFL